MERAVNSDWPTETVRNYNVLLLSAQIRRLIACFDIYLEVTSPDVFEQEKIYFNPTRFVILFNKSKEFDLKLFFYLLQRQKSSLPL